MTKGSLPACTCGRDAKGGPYPRVHAPDCAYVQSAKRHAARGLEHVGATAEHLEQRARALATVMSALRPLDEFERLHVLRQAAELLGVTL